jgi:hypothetical protein
MLKPSNICRFHGLSDFDRDRENGKKDTEKQTDRNTLRKRERGMQTNNVGKTKKEETLKFFEKLIFRARERK